MDALKKIAAGSVKENAPEFHIGDTVKVSVNIREGEREFSRSTARTLSTSRSYAAVRFAAASSTICATESVRLLRSRKKFVNNS